MKYYAMKFRNEARWSVIDDEERLMARGLSERAAIVIAKYFNDPSTVALDGFKALIEREANQQ